MRLWDGLPEWVRDLPPVHPDGGAEWVRGACPRLQAEYRCPKRCRLAQVWVGKPGAFLLCSEDGEKLPEVAIDPANVWPAIRAIREGRKMLIAASEEAYDLDAVRTWMQAFRDPTGEQGVVCRHGRHALALADVLVDLQVDVAVRRVLPRWALAQR